MNSAVAAEFKNGVIVLPLYLKKKIFKTGDVRHETSPNRFITPHSHSYS